MQIRRQENLRAFLIAAIAFTSLLLTTGIAFGIEGDTLNYLVQLERRLEDRISTVVRAQDPDAMVFVQAVAKTSQLQLPLTPFSMPSLIDSDPLGKPEIASVKIEVYVKKNAITDPVRKIINGLARQVSQDAKISIVDRPLTARELSPEVDRQGPKAWFEEAKAFLGGNTLLETLGITEKRVGTAINTLLGSAIGLTVLGILIWYTFISSLRGQSKSIREGVKEVADAFKSGGSDEEGNSVGAALSQMAAALSDRGSSSGSAASSDSAKEFFAELPAEGILAILSDCYWSKLDKYASHIWRNLPLKRRSELLKAWDLLPAYVEHIASLKPEDLQMEQDPAYLNPIDSKHINNDSLTGIVRLNPPLLRLVSLIRRQSLSLTITEQLNITKMDLTITREAANTLCSDANSSVARKFETRIRVREVNLAHEKELMVIRELNKHLLEDLPTLVWATRLSDDALALILRSYSATDLATCWTGPNEVLSKILALLPEKKRVLVESYRTKTKPDRQSAVFKSLHRAIVDAVISGMESGVNGATSSESDARPGYGSNDPKVA